MRALSKAGPKSLTVAFGDRHSAIEALTPTTAAITMMMTAVRGLRFVSNACFRQNRFGTGWLAPATNQLDAGS